MVMLSDVGSGPFNSFLPVFEHMKQSNIFFPSQGIITFKELVYVVTSICLDGIDWNKATHEIAFLKNWRKMIWN